MLGCSGHRPAAVACTLHAVAAFMTPVLFRIDDLAVIRGSNPPVLCIVVDVRVGRLLVAWRTADGHPVYRWMEPTALIQVSAQYALWGIPAGLEALRARQP